MTPPWSGPKASEKPNATHRTVQSPRMKTEFIRLEMTFFLRPRPP